MSVLHSTTNYQTKTRLIEFKSCVLLNIHCSRRSLSFTATLITVDRVVGYFIFRQVKSPFTPSEGKNESEILL